MGVQDHHEKAGTRPVNVHVVIVSSSRTTESDEAGPLLEARLREQGHVVTGREVVPDDAERIGRTLDAAIARADIQAVIVSGGTGISRKDGTYEVVSARLVKSLPGFGEIFRAMSFADVGPAAFLSRAVCGVAGETLIFAIPGSPSACALAMDRLILPEIRHLVWEVGRELPVVAPPRPATPPQVRLPTIVKVTATTTPAPTDAPDPAVIAAASEEPEPPASGWNGAIQGLRGQLSPGTWVEIPAPFNTIDAVRNVLENAGQRGTLALPDGTTLAVFGFPDLLRGSSKVLVVGAGLPWGQIVALHRHPRQVGLFVRGDDRWLPDASTDARQFAEQATGRMPPFEGSLFALDGGTLYLLVDGRIQSWDGRRARDEGTPRSVLGTLALRWSQR